jgi:hypothetical protein
MKYQVELTARAIVETRVEVEADSADEAKARALQQAYSGDVIWKYDGAEDDTAQVEICEPLG